MTLSKYRFNGKNERFLRIPSREDRAKRIKELGGIDDSFLDKRVMKDLEKVHRCYWCKKYLKPVDIDRNTGEILMACNTTGCIGNPDSSKSQKMRCDPQFYARRIDRKLMMDLRDLLYGRDPSRMFAVKNVVW